MKILLLKCGDICYDGVVIMLRNILKYMDKTGMEIWLYANGRVVDEEIAGEFSGMGIILVTGGQDGLDDEKTSADIRRLCRAERFDIVHCNTGNNRFSGIALMAAQAGGNAVRIAHSHNTNGAGDTYSVKANAFRRINRELAHVHLACSASAADHLFGAGCKHIMIRNGIDTARFMFDEKIRKEIRSALGIADDTILIGNTGKMINQKNQEFLLNVMSVLKKRQIASKLIILGEGPLREMLELQVSSLGLTDDVLLPGNIDDVAPYLNAMDVFVMPSVFEGLPVAAVEAQASGLPVILSDVISRETDLTGNVTFLSIEEGAERWADKLIAAASGKRNDMAMAVLEKGFDIRHTAAILRKMYIKIYDKKKGRIKKNG